MKKVLIGGFGFDADVVCAAMTAQGYTIKRPPVEIERQIVGVTFTCVKRSEDDYSIQVGDSGHPFSYGAKNLIQIQDLCDELMEAEVD